MLRHPLAILRRHFGASGPWSLTSADSKPLLQGTKSYETEATGQARHSSIHRGGKSVEDRIVFDLHSTRLAERRPSCIATILTENIVQYTSSFTLHVPKYDRVRRAISILRTISRVFRVSANDSVVLELCWNPPRLRPPRSGINPSSDPSHNPDTNPEDNPSPAIAPRTAGTPQRHRGASHASTSSRTLAVLESFPAGKRIQKHSLLP